MLDLDVSPNGTHRLQPIRYITKVRLPHRRPDVMRRSRLVDFLHWEVDKRLILVCAGAGYGKTTLLVDFAHDAELPVCWYSMDDSDSDPRAFFDYLILSLRQRFPNFGHQSEALLSSLDNVAREINTVVASLVNEIQSDIPDYFVLVLDDYHRVDGSEAVNAALDLLIYYLPENCHLVISSRTLPAFTFSRLAAQRQVAGLGTTDLKFTTEELAGLLRENYKLAMPMHQAEQLSEASEGWITGVLLSTHTLWMGLVESLVKAKGADSPLFDYLANEAYLLQPKEVQRFLLHSSILPQMTPAICDRLIDGGRSAETLEYLVKANLFVAELEGPGEWYRYHNLFQEFLRSKLKTEDPGTWAKLHLQAADIAREAEDWDLSLAHYQAAGASAHAADLVERVGEEVIRSGRWQTLHRWMDDLPQTLLEERPKLALLRGRTCLWAGELDRAVTHLDHAALKYQAAGESRAAAGALNSKSVGLRMRGRLAEALNSSAEALRLEGDGLSPTAASAHRDIGISLAAQGRPEEAAVELQRALEIHEALGDEAGVASTCHAMGVLAVRVGDLARAMSFYQRALLGWQRAGNPSSIAEILNCMGLIHFYTGEYEQARPILENALARAREGGYLRVEAAILGSLGDLKRDDVRYQEAIDCYEAGLEIANRVEEAQLVNYLLDALANAHRLLGDYATAERLQRQAAQRAEEFQSKLELATYSITAGVLAEEQGDLTRAEELLTSATQGLAASGARRDLARSRFHLARTYFSMGKTSNAAEELEACLDLCRQLGYDQFLVAEGQRAAPLLTWAVEEGIGGRRLQLVAQRLGHKHPSAPAGRRPRMRVEQPALRDVRIWTLGNTRVIVDSRVVTSSDWAVEKTKELFFYLYHQPHGVRKEQLIDAIWPDAEFGKSSSQLHSTVYRLRKAIFPQCVAYQNGKYQLTLAANSWSDAQEFDRLLDAAEGLELSPEERLQSYQQAIDLYKGPYLEEIYSDWVLPIRELYEERFVRSLAELARLRAARGMFDQALQLLRKALSINPFQEEIHFRLIHYSALRGDRAAALRCYREYVELLRDELDAQPSPKLSSLADTVSGGEPLPSL